jgi:5-methylcytosine-specific restriction endonuclease McrA
MKFELERLIHSTRASPVHDAACQLHIDHITPFSMDGPTASSNLRTLCSKCNLGRGNDEACSI